MKSLFFFTFKANRLIYLSPPGPEGGESHEAQVQPVVVKEAVTKEQVTAKQAEHSTKYAQTEAQILQYNSHPNSKIKAIAADYHGQFQKLDDPKALLERCKGYGKDLPKKVEAYDKAMTELTGLFSGFEAETSLAIAGEKPLQQEGQKQEVTKTVGRKQETAPVKTEKSPEELARQAKIDDILNLMGQETFEAILDSDEINEVGVIKLNELTEAQVEKLFTFAKGKDNTEKIFDEISYQGKIENNKISVNKLSTNSIKMLIEPFKDNERDVFAIFEKLLTTPPSIQRTIEECGKESYKSLLPQLIKQLPEKIDGKDPIKSLDTNALVILINSDKLETFINRMDAEQKANLLGSKLDVKQKEILFLNIFIKEAKGDLIKLSPPTILEKMIDYAFAKEGKDNIEIKLLTGPALTAEVIGTLTQKAAKILLKKENQDKIDQKDRPKIVETIQAKLSTETKIGLIKELTVNEQDGLRLKLIKSILLDGGISPEKKATILIGIIAAQGEGEEKKLLSIGAIKLKADKGRLYMKDGEYWMHIDTFKLTKTAPKAAVPADQEAKGKVTEKLDTAPSKAVKLAEIDTSHRDLMPSLLTEENFTKELGKKDYAPLLISEEGNLSKLNVMAEKLKALDGKFTENTPDKTVFTGLTEKISAEIAATNEHISQIKGAIEKTDPAELFNPIEGRITAYVGEFEAYHKTFEALLKEQQPKITEAKALATGKQSELKAIEAQLTAIENIPPKDKHKVKLEELRTKLNPKLEQIQKDVTKATAYETIASKSKDFTDNYEKPEKWTEKTQQLTILKGELAKAKGPKDQYEKSAKLKTGSDALIGELNKIKEALTAADKTLLKDDPQKAQIKAITDKIDKKIKEVETKFFKPAEAKTATLEKIKPKTLLKPIEAKIAKYDKGLRAYQKAFDGFLKEKPQKTANAIGLAKGKQAELTAIEKQLTAIEDALPKDSKHKEAIKALREKLKPKKDTIESHIKKADAIKTLQESSAKFKTEYKPEAKWTEKTQTLTTLQGALAALKEPQDTQVKYTKLGELITQSKALKTELGNIRKPLTEIDTALLNETQKEQLTALIKEIDEKIKAVDDGFLNKANTTKEELEKTSDQKLKQAEIDFTARELKAKSDISPTVIQTLASSGNYKDLETLCTAYEADLKGILEKITPFETIYKESNKANFTEITGKIKAEQSRIATFKAFSTEANKEKSPTPLNKFEFAGIELTINDEAKQILTKLGVSLKSRELEATSKFLDYDTAKVIEKITLGKEPFGKIKSIAIKVTDVNSKIWEITTTNELGSTETIKMKGLVIVKTKTEISTKDQQAAKEAVSAKVKAASEKFREITEKSPSDPDKTAAIKAMLEAIPKGTEAPADGIMFKHTADEKLLAQVPGLDFQEVTPKNIHHFALLMKRK